MQHYNRYAYVANSPLRYTDPSGNCPVCFAVIAFIASYEMTQQGNQYWRMVGTFAMMWATQGLVDAGLGVSAGIPGDAINQAAGIANTFNAGGGIGNSFLAAAIPTLATGGSVEQAVTAGIFAGAFTTVGMEFKGQDAKLIASHMLLGCAQGAAAGSACGPSALAAGFGKAATIGLDARDFGLVGNGVTTAIVGGTASVIGGGKFANGAKQAGFGYVFNYMSSKWLRAFVPGQVQFDHGMTAVEEGRLGAAAVHFSAMLGEQVATVLTFGEYGAASTARAALAARWESRFVFQTEHMARHLEGTGLAVDSVKQAIMSDLKGVKYNVGEIIKRDLVVGGQELRYHAFPLKDGSFRIGTIGTPPYGPRF